MFDGKLEEVAPICFHCHQDLSKASSVERLSHGGCIPAPYLLCASCAKAKDDEERAQRYQEKHFCHRCKERFTRPYFKNRKHLITGSRWFRMRYSYCLECYAIELPNLPPREEVQDLWGEFKGGDAESDKNGLW